MKVATMSITVMIAASALLLLSACSVSVDDKDKKNEKVDIQTPFANLKVDSSDKAVNNGIPGYPGQSCDQPTRMAIIIRPTSTWARSALD